MRQAGSRVALFLDDRSELAATTSAARCLGHFDKFFIDSDLLPLLLDVCGACGAPLSCVVRQHSHVVRDGFVCIEYTGLDEELALASGYVWIPSLDFVFCERCVSSGVNSTAAAVRRALDVREALARETEVVYWSVDVAIDAHSLG